jgi:hypothetical protein
VVPEVALGLLVKKVTKDLKELVVKEVTPELMV